MALGSARGGDETYTKGLLTGLAEIVDDDGDRLFPLLVRPGVELPNIVRSRAAFPLVSVGGRISAVRHALTVRRAVSRFEPRISLLHSLIHAPPWPPRPVALYVPDLAFLRYPALHPLAVRVRFRALIPLHIRQARAIITVSEFSRCEIIGTYDVSPDSVFVVPNAVTVGGRAATAGTLETAPRSDEEAPDPLGALGVDPPYLLYLGNLHPRKNVPRLIDAFARAQRAAAGIDNFKLVIAGGRWWGGGEEQRAARQARPGSVVFLGRVPDAVRDALLQRATALLYPSLWEGFGLPPVEAMAVGTPVLASNTSAFPEVLSDAALLVDPFDTDAIARGIVELATSQALRATLIERGRRRAATFTPRAMAERALDAFHWAMDRAA